MSQPYSAPVREAPAAIPAPIDDTPRIRRGQRVWCGNHHVGLVNLLCAPSDGRPRSFVLRRGILRHRDVIVPMTWVADVDERRVRLTAARRDLDTLPAYHDDHLLADAIGRALSADPRLRALGDDGIGVTVEGGNVELRGHVSGSDNTFRVGQAAQAIPGVLRVTNHVVDDGALAMAVARALGTHAATRAQRIHVHARHGVIYLEGDTADVEVRAAAQACAASTPHVRGIVNSIQAPGETIEADAQRVLQPQIGQQIYAPGLRLGTVEQVIISPLRCAVVAMVARGCFAGSARRDDTRSDLPPLQERRVVIPTAAVRAVTQSAVLLRISGDEAADCEAFEPAGFVAPAPGWEPPFPYQRGDVLFVRAPAREIAAPAHPA